MNVVTLPPRERRPTEVKSSPADIVAHPSTPEAFANAAIAKMKEDARARAKLEEAEKAMQFIRGELDLLRLKATALADVHDIHDRVVFLFEAARAQIKADLYPGS